jgi:hypothetical protein
MKVECLVDLIGPTLQFKRWYIFIEPHPTLGEHGAHLTTMAPNVQSSHIGYPVIAANTHGSHWPLPMTLGS